MILLQSPSLVINAHDVPGPKYKMWHTVNAKRGMTALEAVTQIISVNALAITHGKSQLLNVVINCHGNEAELFVGGDYTPPIDINNVGYFSMLKGLNIGTIWLTSCNAARGGAGKQFCQTLSREADSQVVAADSDQKVGIWGKQRIFFGREGLIDEFEGTVYGFTPIAGMYVCEPHSDIFTTLE